MDSSCPCPFPDHPAALPQAPRSRQRAGHRPARRPPAGCHRNPPQDLPPGIHLPEQADVAGEKQRPRSALAGVAERPQPPAVASRERALERVLDPSRSPAGPGQPGSAHDTLQLRRNLVSGGRAMPSIGGHLARRRPPNRSCRTDSTRPATGYIDRWHHAKCPGRLRRTHIVPPFGTPRTMTVRLVADIQNRLFWRVGTGLASECCVPSAGWSQASRDG